MKFCDGLLLVLIALKLAGVGVVATWPWPWVLFPLWLQIATVVADSIYTAVKR